ncbi:MAG: SPOR domain-containing protein [Rickettsia endosymbiont of Bryobia graminum]|nr:SPOR domain-containing protein [Rickettsia endosymbiont of Bryobia graminum]
MTGTIFFRVIIILVIISGISYWFYNNYDLYDKEIVIIYPDPAPTKVKPKETGGIAIANANNLVYESLGQKKPSKQIILQPEPEKPLNIAPSKFVEKSVDSVEDIISIIVENDQSNSSTDRDIAADITKDNIVQEKELEEQANSKIDTQPNPNKTGLNVVKVTEKRNINTKQLSRQKNQNDYKIQLASVKSELVANQEVERIKKKYTKVLGKAPFSVKKVRSEKGVYFYSVFAGSYKNISEAKSVCKKLDAHQECIIVNR